jgi:hypothetical protein
MLVAKAASLALLICGIAQLRFASCYLGDQGNYGACSAKKRSYSTDWEDSSMSKGPMLHACTVCVCVHVDWLVILIYV